MIEENTPNFNVGEKVRFVDVEMDHNGEECEILRNDLGAGQGAEPVYNIKFKNGGVLKGMPESCLESL